MCRLLGWVTSRPTTLDDLLGADDLAAFTDLSSRHRDGWGVARATDTGVKVHKRPDTARENRSFGAWARQHAGDLGMAHLRRATMGLSVNVENTHPFTDGSVAFAHNGSVLHPGSLDRLIDRRVARLRRGTTDSERYFLAVLTRMRRGASPHEALLETADDIAGVSPFTGLNCLLVTPTELLALCRYDAGAPLEDSDPGYYRLGYRVAADGVVVSSSGWGRGWQEIGNGELLTVQRGTLDVVVHTRESLLTAA